MIRRMNNASQRWLSSTFGLLLLAAATAACEVRAATVQMTVLNADGKPAPDTVVLVQPTASWPARVMPATATIEQRGSRFMPYVTVVPVGASVRFVNQDPYDHHVRSQPGGPLGSIAPATQFEYRLAPSKKGIDTSPDLKLDVPGTILVGCHIHGSMRGHIFVVGTPWFAVADDQGRVKIEGVPDGQAEVRLWHPDQLVEQASMRVQVSGTVAQDGKLNFTPRRRPPPRTAPKGEYDTN
jgi:plastocyanin